MKDRKSKPEEYTYEDIYSYYYNSDKIMMTNGVVFDISKLTHLPRAIEYANADDNKREAIIITEKKPTKYYKTPEVKLTHYSVKMKPSKPKTPLKNRMKQLGR